MTGYNLEIVQNSIINKLAHYLPGAEFTRMADGVWIQYRERWMHVIAEFQPGERHWHRIDWTIQRGLEAGYDLIGGEYHEEPAFAVRGFKFGVMPKAIQWIKEGKSPAFI